MIGSTTVLSGTDFVLAAAQDTGEPEIILLVFVAFALVAMVISLGALVRVAFKYKRQQRSIFRQELHRKEVAGRRRIRMSDKYAVLERDDYTCQICGISRDYLDSLCPGLGDYLLLEVDHIRSVSQGGSGRDIDNLQCLCWRCNRKKGGWKTNEEVRDSIDYGIDFLDTGYWF